MRVFTVRMQNFYTFINFDAICISVFSPEPGLEKAAYALCATFFSESPANKLSGHCCAPWPNRQPPGHYRAHGQRQLQRDRTVATGQVTKTQGREAPELAWTDGLHGRPAWWLL